MTTRTFSIGPGVECDTERLVSTRLLVQANSGGGKSWMIRRLLEQTHGAVQQIVIDPEGEFASLREKYDYVLAARQGGDTLADPRTAKLLAERLLELGVSAILDIYELDQVARVKFVRLFLEALVDAPKNLWHPVLVVIDEAHVYCPEKDQAESSAAVKALCSRGRKRGFCAVLATQRLSKLAKDAAAECNNKLIGRTSLDVDMSRAGDELGFTKADRLALRDLDDGQFFAFGPALTRQVTKVKVGPVQTTHPKAGAHIATVVPPPTAKVKALLPKLSDLPAEAEAREKTVTDFKKEIVTLRRELSEARKAQPAAIATRVEVPVLRQKALAGLERVLKACETACNRLDRHSDSLAIASTTIATALARVGDQPQRQVATSERSAGTAKRLDGRPRRVAEPRQKIVNHVDMGELDMRLPPGEYATLVATLQYQDGLDRKRLSVLTGYKRSSRDAYITRLVQKGLIEVNGGLLFSTDAGMDALPDFKPLPTGSDLVSYWLDRLPEGERATLDVLLKAHGKPVARERIDEVTDYKRSSRDAYLTRLKARGLVEFSGRGTVQASAELFQ